MKCGYVMPSIFTNARSGQPMKNVGAAGDLSPTTRTSRRMTGARVGLKHVSHNRPRARDHPGSGRVGQLRQYQSAPWMITASARLRHEERPSGELRVLSQVSAGLGSRTSAPAAHRRDAENHSPYW